MRSSRAGAILAAFRPRATLGTLVTLCLFSFTLVAPHAQAQDTSAVTDAPATTSAPAQSETSAASVVAEYEEKPFRIYGNLGTGLGLVTGSGYADRSSGVQYFAGALLSYEAPSWIFDAGLNWFYSQVSGSVDPTLNADVRTRAALVDVSPRYRLTDRWQIGPVFDLAFGTDTGFAPSVAGNSSRLFFGGRLAYEFPVAQFPMRVYTQALSQGSSGGRQVGLFAVGLQFGLPIGGASTQSDELTTSPAAPAAPTAALPEDQPPTANDLTIELDPGRIFFRTNSAEIRPRAEKVLEDAGAYLADNPDRWSNVELAGHADQRGSYVYNLKLSGRRAIAVLAALSKNGADPSRMDIRAFSWLKPSDPHNNRSAWAKNRRVVIIFRDVKEPGVLKNKLQPLAKEGYGNESKFD